MPLPAFFLFLLLLTSSLKGDTAAETLLQCRGAENYVCQHLQPWLQRISFSTLFLVLDFPLGAPYSLQIR